MDTTSSQVLEITLISGEELFIDRTQRVKKNAFTVVKTDAWNCQKTNEDKDGGSNPSWNQKILMNLPNHATYFTVEVHCRTSSGNKVVGVANVPKSDFLGGHVPQGYLHLLSYRLRDLNGVKNGIVNLSVRVGGGGRPGVGIPVDEKMPSSSGIVTGFPVGCN